MSTEKGAHSVEVVTTFGDSVIAIEQCGVPIPSRSPRILVAIAVTCLCMSAFAFWRAVDMAHANRLDGIYQTEVLKRPAYAIRPRPLHPIYDALAVGGLLGAIVTSAAAFALRRRQPPTSVCVGDAVVSASEQGFAFSAPGYATLDPIPADARLRVDVGAVTVFVSAVAHPGERVSLMPRGADRKMIAFVAGSLVLHATAWAIVELTPAVADAPTIELARVEETQVTMMQTAQSSQPPPKLADEVRKDRDEGEGAAMPLAGMQLATHAPTLGREARERVSTPSTKAEALQAARTAGVLGAIASDSFSKVTGDLDISSGFDDKNIYGGLLGNEAGEMNGGFGFGRSGFGPGGGTGGGTGWGTIGTGRYGTIGHGAEGSGYGVGRSARVRSSSSSYPTVTLQNPACSGGCDYYYRMIYRYFRHQRYKLQYCYEKKLLATPGLAGTVTVSLVIMPSGLVSAALATGMDDEVGKCVADVVKAIEFPRTKTGEAVNVVYPIVFRPAGS